MPAETYCGVLIISCVFYVHMFKNCLVRVLIKINLALLYIYTVHLRSGGGTVPFSKFHFAGARKMFLNRL